MVTTRGKLGRVRTVLSWCGAVLYPLVMILVVSPGSRPDRAVGAQAVLAVALTVLLTGLLRRSPLVGLVFVLVGSGVAASSRPGAVVTYPLLLVGAAVVGHIVATRSRRSAIAAAAVALPAQLLILGISATRTEQELFLLPVLTLLAAWLLGYSIRERREHSAELAAQTAAQAVTSERLRIARELHDMIAHSIGVIAIQAGVGSRVIDTQPAEARNALTTIEATSRETLSGLRRTLGALRRTDAGADPESVPLEPTPGLVDLDRLVASTRDAGVRADVEWQGERRELPADIDLAAFRIVQESLTNVVRHAGVRECRVTIDVRDPQALALSVVDEGKGAWWPRRASV